MLDRVVNAVVAGLVTGIVVALIIWVISALIPGIALDPGFWGTIAGVLAALVAFFSGRTIWNR